MVDGEVPVTRRTGMMLLVLDGIGYDWQLTSIIDFYVGLNSPFRV